jgi:1-deoxy-D-xylulose-5-phosphate synthase
MWDMAMLRVVPGLRLAAPRDEATLRDALRTAVDVDDAPTVIRYPKGSPGPDLSAIDRLDDVDVIARTAGADPVASPRVLLVGIGAMARVAVQVAEILGEHGVAVTVAAPTWVLPLPAALTKLAGESDLVVTIEDGVADGGIGGLLGERVVAEGHRVRVLARGLPTAFLDHASRDEIVSELHLTAGDIAADVVRALDAGER